MSDQKFDYVYVDCDADWCAIYLNGVCLCQDHSIDASEVFDLIMTMGGKITSYKKVYADEEALEGYFPDKLEEVVLR